MRNTPQKLKSLGWNRQALTVDDFHNACENDGVIVLDYEMPDALGKYVIYEAGQEAIIIRPSLRGHWRALVSWHEFAHHLWHVPGYFNFPGKTELEADLVAYAAILPQSLLREHDHAPGELVSLYGYPPEIVNERLRLYERFQF